MNGRAIPGAYLFRLYVCDKEMSRPHHIGETHQPDWVVYVPDIEKFRLTNVIPERIIFVSRGITVVVTEACNVLRCRMCSSYTVVLVRLLVGGRVGICEAAAAAASWTGSCDLPRPVSFLSMLELV